MVALAAACANSSSPDDDTDDTNTTAGSGSGSGSGGAGVGGAGSGAGVGSGGAGTCNSSPWTEDTTCNTCLEGNCCFALNACEAGSPCIALKDCVEQCAGDLACGATCVDTHEAGIDAVDALAACNTDSCQGCASVPPTTFDACAATLAEHQNSPNAACAEANCCDEVAECVADPSCHVGEALSGDAAPSSLLTCIYDHCGS